MTFSRAIVGATLAVALFFLYGGQSSRGLGCVRP